MRRGTSCLRIIKLARPFRRDRGAAPGVNLGPRRASRVTRPLALALVAALLSGCASFSPDGGVDLAADVARRELGQDAVAIRTLDDAAAAKERVGRLLKRPLNANGAVEVALRSNRGLQAAYNRLGIAEAIMVRESLPPNPNFSLGRVAGPLSSEIEGAIAADILALATLPARADIAADQLRGGATGGGRSDPERREGGAQGILPGRRRARNGPCHGTGRSGGGDRGEALPPTWRNRGDAQARSSPRPAFPCRDRRQARERPPKGVQRARAARPRAGPLGSRSFFRPAGRAAEPAGAYSRHAQGRTGGGRTPHRSPNRPKETRCARQVPRTRRSRRAMSIFSSYRGWV